MPLQDSIDYLGCCVGYKHFTADTVRKRMEAANTAFHRLKAVLCCRTVSLAMRIRLWKACVLSTGLHGLVLLPMAQAQVLQVRRTFVKQLRNIARSPVHISREKTSSLLQRLQVEDPIQLLCNQARDMVFTTERLHSQLPTGDVRVSPELTEWEARQQQHWQHILRDSTPLDNAAPALDLQCNQCDYRASSVATLKRRMIKQHQAIKANLDHRPWKHVDRRLHGLGGMPTCAHCKHPFLSWQALQKHVYRRSCKAMFHTQPVEADGSALIEHVAPRAVPDPEPGTDASGSAVDQPNTFDVIGPALRAPTQVHSQAEPVEHRACSEGTLQQGRETVIHPVSTLAGPSQQQSTEMRPANIAIAPTAGASRWVEEQPPPT